MKLDRIQSWWNKGKSFSIEIRHIDGSEHWKNRWYVYVYLFPTFQDFESYKESYMDVELPFDFHGGATYSNFKYDKDGNILSKCYGCDYAHAYDEHFSNYETIDDAYEVKRDAEEIYNILTNIVNNNITKQIGL
jgi:hypothetical protein